MSRFSVIDYERIGRENLKKFLGRRNALKRGSFVIREVPADDYFKANVGSLKYLLDAGYEGVFLSLQRPFRNLVSLFEKYGVDVDRLLVVDGASVFCGMETVRDPRCVDLSPGVDFGGLVEAVIGSIPRLKSSKRFVFVDSLSTLALYDSSREGSRFSDLLVDSVKKDDFKDVVFLFNVAEELSQSEFVENLAVYADSYIHLGLCT